MHHICFSRSSVSGQLGGFHVLSVMNSTAVDIGVHIYFQINACIYFSRCIPSLELLDHMAVLILVFGGNFTLSSFVAAPIYVLTNSVGRFLLHVFANFFICDFLMIVILIGVR